MARRIALVLALSLFGVPDLFAQLDRYGSQYGEPVDVSLEDLVNNPGPYSNRAVRTRGVLEMATLNQGGIRPALRSTFRHEVLLFPVSEVEFEWDQEHKRWFGEEVELTGVFSEGVDQNTRQRIYQLVFWAYLGPPEKPSKDAKSELVTLEELMAKPGRYDGKYIRVVGKFRGQNLYGDLPSRSQRRSSDWVIKDDLYAVWVTGRRPKGEGWALDSKLKRDTGKWIDVVGRATTANGVTYLEAIQVALGSAPARPNADAAPPPPPPEKPKVPPAVVFSLPLDGDREVSPTGRFAVQFSKDMKEESFRGRVVLRYAGRPQPGDRDFVGAKITYDGGKRVLIVDPGDVLRSGRVVELILLPGIVDVDGLSLETRPGKGVDQTIAEVLRYQVGF